MRSERIVNSWNKIEPDARAEARMLDLVMAKNHPELLGGRKAMGIGKRLWPAAALVALSLIVLFGMRAGWLGGGTYRVRLGDAGTLSFPRVGSIGAIAFVWDVDWGESMERHLTLDEQRKLFGGLSVEGDGAVFRSKDGALMRFEGTVGDVKLVLAAHDHAAKDTLISGNEGVSNINGQKVSAGYFVTGANSHGVKTIIYFATFTADETIVYAELAGPESDSQILRTRIADMVRALTFAQPDASSVTAW